MCSKKQRILRGIICLLAAGVCSAGGVVLIPLMQAIEVGTAYESADAADAAEASPAEPEPPAPAGTQDSVLRETAPAPERDIIAWESAGSAAMHSARPYLNPLTDIAGSIVKKHFGAQSGTPFFTLENGGQVRNTTAWSNADLAAESRISPDLPLKTDGTPMVLIYHTHTTESYQLTDAGVYDSAYNFRTTDPEKNTVAVGEAIAEQLAAAGIGVVHAAEIHDYPVWNGSYTRSAETVRSILREYPSICIALDIHRDAIANGTTVYAPAAEIGGRQAAQIMIISGCDDGTMDMPEYRRNFHLASCLQQTAETMFAGFTRPVLFDYRKYNQDLTTGSLLIEVGSQGNTLDEAEYAGELLGKALAEMICTLAARQEQT